MNILLLGGTAEARALATMLLTEGHRVTSSLAGRVSRPALPAGEVRVGGFGGIAGLAAYLVEHRVEAVVDATHPFADRIGAHAALACAELGVPLLRVERPGWSDHADARTWTWVPDASAAVRAGADAARPFLTTGRQSLEAFLPWADRSVLARVVDPPAYALPPAWRLLRSRGPYDLVGERAILSGHATDLLVTKDSGGAHTQAKLAAARELGVRVVVIARPPRPSDVRVVAAPSEVLAALTGT